MSFWSHHTWLDRGAREGVIDPWDAQRIKEADYLLSVGKEYFTNGKGSRKAENLKEGGRLTIAPGEFVFILTEEQLNIPLDAIGFISARASTKFRGLVNVSGFQVNPGFKGNFIFAMFNAGPMHIHLRRGDAIFSIWIAHLDRAINVETTLGGEIPNTLSHIPSDILNRISGEALTAYQVKETVDGLTSELAIVKERFIYLATAMAVMFGMALLFFGPELRDRIFGGNDPVTFQSSDPPE